MERQCYVGDDLHETARFVKREIFDKIGGYDESLIGGEDYDFQRRLNKGNYRTGRVEGADYHLREERSVADIIKRSFYYGETLTFFYKKYKISGIKQFSPIRKVYFTHWKLWLKNPFLLVGFIFFKIVQYIAGGVGFIYQSIKNIFKLK